MKSAARERRKIAGDARRVVVKIGSSLITDGRQLSAEKIDALAETVSRHHGEGREMLITSSGAIAAGMAKLGLSRRPQNIPEKQAAAAIGQSYLMWAYERAFSRRGCQVAQILLTRDEFSFRKRYLNARNTLFTLLAHRVVPIVNENDSVAVEEIQVGDNDSLSATGAARWYAVFPGDRLYRSEDFGATWLVADDVSGTTLVTASSLEKAVKEQGSLENNVAMAQFIGKLVGERAVEKGIKKVVFDRNGFLYHGRVKAVSEGARETGLKF